jgi:GNAT superfamily N-acetyltransferase
MEVREVGSGDRSWVADLLSDRWGSTCIARRDELVDAGELPGFVAEIDGEPVGLVTFRESRGEIEVVTLDASRQSVGVGTALLAAVEELARGRHARRVWLATTNDNAPALAFYLRRGFRLVAVHIGAVDRARAAKPAIPALGVAGIEIHDEIELARALGERPATAPTGSRPESDKIALASVAAKDRAVLAGLLGLRRDECSARRPELTDDGTFSRGIPDAPFAAPGAKAWFICYEGRPAGFAMARGLPGGAHEVAEFFVVPAHRRLGVGRRAATALFARLPGSWEVAYDLTNKEACRFWPAVVGEAATGPVDCRREGPPVRTCDEFVLRFPAG